MNTKIKPKVTGKRRPAQEVFLDNLAAWLAGRSRFVRSVVAGIIALILDGALILIFFGILLGISPGSFTYYALSQNNFLTIVLVLVIVLGLVFYWFGWRLLIGFDLSGAVLQPGRRAALWVVLGTSILILGACLLSLTVLDALR